MLWLLVSLVIAGCGSDSETRQLVRRIRSGSTAARLKAVSEAEERPNSAIRAELLKVFDNQREEPILRGGAALALGRLHDPRLPARVVQRLPAAILAAGKPGPLQTESYILSKALTACGPDSLTAIAPLLRSPRKEIVAWTIAHHGLYRRNDRALEVLSQYLNSPEALYRRSAAYGLAECFHPAGEAVVLKHLADPDPEVRYHLAWALENYGSAASLAPAAAQLARENQPQVKKELSRAIDEIRARQGQSRPVPAPAAPAPKTR